MSAGLRPPQAVAEEVLAEARRLADDCIVVVEETSEVDVRFANNTTTTNGTRRNRSVTAVAFRTAPEGTRMGVAARRGDVDPTDLVRHAVAGAAGAGPADDAAPLLDPADVHMGEDPGTSFDQDPGHDDLSVLADVINGLSGAFRRARTAGHVLAGFAEHRHSTTYLASSTGIRLGSGQPQGTIQLVARDEGGQLSAWAGAGTALFDDVSLDRLEDQVVSRLGWARRTVEWPAGRCEIVLPPEAVADLMIALAFETGGRGAEDGTTVFSKPGGGTRVGEVLSPVPFELRSDPREPGLECAPFVVATASSANTSVFDNGLPLDRTEWIAAGRLRRLRYHRAGAARFGAIPTPFAANLLLDVPGSSAAEDDLVATTERGLLVTCLWYIREVDPVTMLLTGLTRDGVYVIENGKVVGSTTNFRFNESPVDLLARATEVGASRRALGREFGEYLSRTRMPALRIPDFNLSSVSRAS